MRARIRAAERWPTYAFAAVIAAALPLYLFLGRSQWFWNDEWDFLAARNGGSLHDLLRPHNGHWSTLPILEYRLLWHLVGLRSYVPYQLPVIVLHLTAAVLLWLLIDRLVVRRWVSTLLVSVFVLYGSGRQNIVWAFQVGFDASLVLGLSHLLLADHDGPLDRRDAAGIACGVLGLLCSALSITMVLVVGFAVLLRRGWRAAAAHTLPAAAVFLTWSLYVILWLPGDRGSLKPPKASPADIVSFVLRGVSAAFDHLGQLPGVGAAIFVVLALGLVLAWAGLPLQTLRRRAAIPISLLLGAVAFLTSAGIGRVGVLGTDFADRSRFSHLTIAMALPALAVAVDTIVRRWRVVGYVVVALMLVGLPGNLREVGRGNEGTRGVGQIASSARFKSVVLAMARLPLARRVPRTDVPDATLGEFLTVGWLLDAAASERLPSQGHASSDSASAATIRLGLSQASSGTPSTGCRVLTGPRDLTLTRGDRVAWMGGDLLVRLMEHGRAVGSVVYMQEQGDILRARASIAARFQAAGQTPIRLCDPESAGGAHRGPSNRAR